jgi:tetratricopeptide (TPR) repeat protein
MSIGYRSMVCEHLTCSGAPGGRRASRLNVSAVRGWQTNSVVFVADDLGAWLVGLLADAGRRRLGSVVLGSDQQRALRSAAAAAVRVTAGELCPGDRSRAEELAMVISQVFGEPGPVEGLAGYESVLEALQAGVAVQLAVLDDAEMTGTGESAAAVMGVSGSTVAEKLTRHLLREIVERAASGAPLTSLAAQLNHDATHLHLARLQGSVDRLADDVVWRIARELRTALADLGPGRAVVPVMGQRVVAGDIPHEPPGYQLRDGLMAELGLDAGAGHVSVVYALTGLRGTGKTHVAAAYVRARIADGWRLVAWVHADDQDAIVSGLGAVASAMGLDSTRLDGAGVGQLVRHRLEVDGDRCVIVFDNADDPDALRPFLPSAGSARVLITSTRQSMGRLGRRVQVGEFSVDQALAFLAARTGRGDLDGARRLSDELGCLPLALAQAAAVIADQQLDYRTYLRRLGDMPVEKLLGRVEAGQYPRGVASAILLSFENVRSDDETGLCASVMELISILSPAGVSRQLLHMAGRCCVLGAARQPAAPEEVDRALGRLAGSSLLIFTGDGVGAGAHRLVSRVIRERLTQEGRLGATGLDAAKVLDALCAPVWEARQDRVPARALVQQIFALNDYFAVAAGKDAGNAGIVLLELRMWALTLMNHLGDSAATAVTIGEPLFAEAERVLGAEHHKTLNTGNDLATAYRAAGQAAQAITLHEKIAGTSSKVLGDEHPHTLGYLGNLANAFQDAGRTSDAIAVHQHVLASRERMLGTDHPDTLTARGNLAVSYQVAGRTSEAIVLTEQVLADQERVLGLDHPETLRTRNNLANAYHEAGRVSDSLPLYAQAIADHEQILGPDHPATLTARINFANAVMDDGRPAEALEQHRRALADCEQNSGLAHPITLAAQASLATACMETGDLREAIQLYERALAGQERALGPVHPRTLTCRGNLAVAYRRAGQWQQAIRLLEDTAANQQRILGPQHPDTLNSLNNLANAYQAAGQLARALPLYEQVLESREQILGAEHPNTLISRGNLANIYAQTGRLSEAATLYESALAGCERILGTDHPATQATRYNFKNAHKWKLPDP